MDKTLMRSTAFVAFATFVGGETVHLAHMEALESHTHMEEHQLAETGKFQYTAVVSGSSYLADAPIYQVVDVRKLPS